VFDSRHSPRIICHHRKPLEKTFEKFQENHLTGIWTSASFPTSRHNTGGPIERPFGFLGFSRGLSIGPLFFHPPGHPLPNSAESRPSQAFFTFG
jgi:hypothetical protein